MVSSMTGFGRADFQADDCRVSAELRSVNHRFLEVSPRIPRSLAALEPRVVDLVKGAITRGKVNVTLELEGQVSGAAGLSVDETVAERYLEIAEELKTRYNLDGSLDIQTFIGLPSVISREESDLTEETAWALIRPPLEEAVEALKSMRRREGAALARDLRDRVEAIASAVDRVAERVPLVVEQAKTRLADRLAEISEDAEYNRFRLEAEMTFFADRADITEECVRLRSHCEQFAQFMDADEPAGRRLKFLLEEMHREVNTIGSKGQNPEISREVIFMKEEVEKIREQVLNIE